MQLYRTPGPMGEQYIQENDVEIPAWIDEECFLDKLYPGEKVVWVCSIKDLCQGGCASGQYMPAVTYYQAIQTMSDHGDEVLAYIYEQLGEVPGIDFATTYPGWGNIAVHYLSLAVELWAHGVLTEIENAEEAA